MKCILESQVLRVSARLCTIHLKTSFRWRHRFLELLTTLNTWGLEGIIEADETQLPWSEEGSRTLTRKTLGSEGRKSLDVADPKKIGCPFSSFVIEVNIPLKQFIPDVSEKTLVNEWKGKLQKDSVLCSDGLKPYVEISLRIDKVFHIKGVNAYHSCLNGKIKRIHEVATKYLDHYLVWHRYMDITEELNENRMLSLQQQFKQP